MEPEVKEEAVEVAVTEQAPKTETPQADATPVVTAPEENKEAAA